MSLHGTEGVLRMTHIKNGSRYLLLTVVAVALLFP
ncbi:MAG: carbohydrate ABC transporter permease, partial [Lacticaseibacillus paracasei]|nr:carbohydrate ABC transporter permease [Lacticaseibacillus paracasei]